MSRASYHSLGPSLGKIRPEDWRASLVYVCEWSELRPKKKWMASKRSLRARAVNAGSGDATKIPERRKR